MYPLAVSLASGFAPFVPAKIRKRGQEYFDHGLVEVSTCTSEDVAAVVSGTEAYRVFLQREGPRVWASCSCPFVADREEVCKHIWATVLAADEQGGLRGPRGGLPKELYAEFGEDWDLEDPGDDFEDEAPFPSALPPPPRAEPPRAPAWREVLTSAAAESPAPPPRDDEILYAVNLDVSLKQQVLALDLLTLHRKKDGSPVGLYPLRMTRAEIGKLRNPEDRQVLALITGAINDDGWRWGLSPSREIVSEPWIPHDLAPEVARRICATGRCRLGLQNGVIRENPMTWDDGPPWELWLAIREREDGACELIPELHRGAERLDWRERFVLAASGLVLSPEAMARLDPGSPEIAAFWRRLALRAEPLRIPAAEREDLLAALFAAPALPRLDLPPSLACREEPGVPRPRLRLFPARHSNSDRGWPEARLSYLYEEGEVPAGSRARGVYRPEGRRFLLRDSMAEAKAFLRLAELGFRPAAAAAAASSGEPLLRIASNRVPRAVRALLGEGWSVEAEGKLYRTPGKFAIRVASGVDWFELHGEADFEGEAVSLPRLLAALRRGDGFVPLSDGGLGLLPEEWLARWAPLAAAGQTAEDHVRFTAPQALLLDAWLAEEPAASCDETFARARERLRAFQGIAPADPPPGFHGSLRPYQKLGLGWLSFLRDFGLGGCLADDMGLGKTVQVLALLESRRERREKEGLPPSLVVVPRSLVFNWLAEAEQFAPALQILNHTGVGRTEEMDRFAAHDVVLTTYGTLRRDIGRLKEAELDYVILDEAQAIKNAGSQTAKAARLLHGRHRLALTGTPVENHLGELWSLLEFLNPGFLGRAAIGGSGGGGGGGGRAKPMTELGGESLGRALRPLILRRTKQQVAPELPARVEQTLLCELAPEQRRLYDELRDYYRAVLTKRIGTQGLGRSKLLVLEALLRLRQAACHPALLDRGTESAPSAKLDLLLPQLAEVLDEGHKALVFSQFTSFLTLLKRQLDAAGVRYLYLDGRTRNRGELVEEFQSEGGCSLFLISLKAGGLGLNLTAADYVYLLDPWWNPAVEAQAVDRAHRIGQTRTVFAYRLIAKDTVEEKILELQGTKKALAEAIVQADESLMAKLSREDLELLLS